MVGRYLMCRHTVWGLRTHHGADFALRGSGENHLRLEGWVKVDPIYSHRASSTANANAKKTIYHAVRRTFLPTYCLTQTYLILMSLLTSFCLYKHLFFDHWDSSGLNNVDFVQKRFVLEIMCFSIKPVVSFPRLVSCHCWLSVEEMETGLPDEGMLGLDAGDVRVLVVGVADWSLTDHSINVYPHFVFGWRWLRWCPTR